MGSLDKPRFWCGNCHKGFRTLFELQFHPHKREAKKPRLKRQSTLKIHSYFCLKCKMKHEEGVVSYTKHMEFKRGKGRPVKT